LIIRPIMALAVTAGVTLLGFALEGAAAPPSLPMLYLAGVVFAAISGGLISALIAAGASFLSYNFFFIEPRWTFSVAHSEELLTLLAFVAVALVTGGLAARLADYAADQNRQALANRALLDFSRKLSAAPGLDNVIETIVGHVASIFGLKAVLLLPDDTGALEATVTEPGTALDDSDMQAARSAYSGRVPGSLGTSKYASAEHRFFPMLSGSRVVGVCGIGPSDGLLSFGIREEELFLGLLDQAAIAIDRAQYARESARLAMVHESERLQSALLSSLSHDLRTPLASITGAASSLRQLSDRLDDATRQDLLKSIEEDADQLNRFVANLLDMTRIESGGLRVRREPIEVSDVIKRAVGRVGSIAASFAVTTSIAPDMPAALGDPILLEQVLFNVLDNARKYANSDAPVAVFARRERDTILLSVTDRGRGIPVQDLERIFDKFYRRGVGDGRPPGTGLGLSIARGFMSAMGGTIAAQSPARRGGTRFLLRLPIAPRDEGQP
jgi:two-component system sensor histidine kinase KdpD